MARPVKVQLSLIFDEELQPNQTHYDLAVAVEQKWRAQGLTVDNVKIDDGSASFSLRTPINQNPPKNQSGSQPPAGEVGNATTPYRAFNFRSGARSTSNPETSAALSAPAIGDNAMVHGPAGTITFGHSSPFAAKLHISRKDRAKRFERLGLPVPPNARMKRRHRAEAAQDGSREKLFRHDFESAGFNKRLRKQGLSAAAGPSNVSRMRKAITRRAERSEAKRWSSYGNPDEDKKVDLLAQELASAFDIITPGAAKPEPNPDHQSTEPLSVQPAGCQKPFPIITGRDDLVQRSSSSPNIAALKQGGNASTAYTDAGTATGDQSSQHAEGPQGAARES